MNAPDFPLLGYEYNTAGFHAGATELADVDALLVYWNGVVKTAMADEREVRITDVMDMLVFHTVAGEIMHPHVFHATPLDLVEPKPEPKS